MGYRKFLPDKRVAAANVKNLVVDRTCFDCNAFLLRVAERDRRHPYHWKPRGYICSKCNTMYLEELPR